MLPLSESEKKGLKSILVFFDALTACLQAFILRTAFGFLSGVIDSRRRWMIGVCGVGHSVCGRPTSPIIFEGQWSHRVTWKPLLPAKKKKIEILSWKWKQCCQWLVCFDIVTCHEKNSAYVCKNAKIVSYLSGSQLFSFKHLQLYVTWRWRLCNKKPKKCLPFRLKDNRTRIALVTRVGNTCFKEVSSSV